MRLKKQRIILPLVIMLFLIASPQAEASGCPSDTMFFGVALDGHPIGAARLKQVADDIGAPPEMVTFFLQWPGTENRTADLFPEASLTAIWETGAIACLTWEPMYYSESGETMIPYRAILGGAYDTYLMAFAKQAAAWQKPFMIRFAHEMNIDRYHWGTPKSQYGPESPGIYKRMFRYVAGMFQKAGARNVLWVFCPNSESVPQAAYDPGASWNRVENYYPGDEYIDILGIDGYNWGVTQTRAKNGWDSQWKPFAEIFTPGLKKLRKLAPHKPVMIFETASVSQGGDKKLWIKNAFETARNWKLKGLTWFQVKKEYDWRINSEGNIGGGMIRPAAGCSPHQWIGDLIK